MEKVIKKVIHLSDIHIKKNDPDELNKLDTLIDKIIEVEIPEVTLVVFTGDLCDNANDIIYSQHPIIPQLNRLKSLGFSLFIIAGNHDYGLGLDWLGEKSKYIQEFKDTFFKYNDNTCKDYPIISTYNNVVCIGLDSTAAEISKFLNLSEGEIGTSQLNKLDSLLSTVKPGVKKIVSLHHHPFSENISLLLKDRKKLIACLDKHKVDILLFGHIHHEANMGNDCHFDKNIAGIFNAGSSVNTDDLEGWNVHYREIDLSVNPFTNKIVDLSANIEEGTYLIKNLDTDYVLTAKSGGKEVFLEAYNSALDEQKWLIRRVSGNTYHIESLKYPGKVLDQSSGAKKDVQLWDNLGNSDKYRDNAINQKWTFEPSHFNGVLSYKIYTLWCQDMVLDSSDGNKKKAQMWKDLIRSSKYCENANNQRWILQKQ